MIYLRNLLLLTVSLSGLTFASFTFAQSDADQEEVVVTGSRIERPEISSNVPVTVLDRADIGKNRSIKPRRYLKIYSIGSRFSIK